MAHIIIDDLGTDFSYAVGASAQSAFAIPFAFFAASDVKVYNGTTLLTLTTHYTIAGTAVDAGFSGGTVNLVTAVTNTTIRVLRDTAIKRVTDYPNSGPLQVAALNTDLDRLVAIGQELDERIADIDVLAQATRDLVGLPATGSTSLVIASRAALALATMDATTAAVLTLGYGTAGDGGGARYKRVAVQPSHAARVRSVDRYLPNGTTDTTNGGWWELVPGDGVYPEQLGAAANGSADDRQPLSDWLDLPLYIPNVKLRLAGKTYKQNSAIAKTYAASGPDIEADRGAIIDFSAAPTGTVCWTFRGSEGATTALAANAARLDKSVTATGFTAVRGDLVRIASNALFDSFDTLSELGEIAEVDAVTLGTPNTIFVWDPLESAYATADSAVISKITPARNIRVKGVTFKGQGFGVEGYGLAIFLAWKPLVEDCHFDKCATIGLWYRDTLFDRTVNCSFEGVINDQGYAVTHDNACRGSLVADCSSRYYRHFYTTSNSTATKGIPRHITVQNCDVDHSATAVAGSGGDALDTHPAAEDIHFLSNTVRGSSGNGINFECRSGSIIGNKIFRPATYGIEVHNESDYAGNVIVHDNQVYDSVDDGIRVTQGTRGTAAVYEQLSVCDNVVLRPGQIGIRVSTPGAGLNEAVKVDGNTVLGWANVNGGLYVEGVRFGSVNANIVGQPTGTGATGIYILDCSNLAVDANTVRLATGATGVGIYIDGVSAACAVSGNRVSAPSSAGATGLKLGASATNVAVGENNFIGCTTEIDIGAGTGHRANLSGSMTYDPPSIAAGAVATQVVTVTGAAVGDQVIGISHTQVNTGLLWDGVVSGANAVTVQVKNESGGAIDLASGTLRVTVRKAA